MVVGPRGDPNMQQPMHALKGNAVEYNAMGIVTLLVAQATTEADEEENERVGRSKLRVTTA